MIGCALIVALATLATGLVAALLLRRLPTLRLQLAGLGLLAVALPLAAVLLSGTVMFDSAHDLTILFVAGACSTAALVAAFLLGGSILRGIERVRGASSALAHGDLGARAPEGGPAELAELAASFNELAMLEALEDGSASRPEPERPTSFPSRPRVALRGEELSRRFDFCCKVPLPRRRIS